MFINTRCTKCGEAITLDFGGLTKEEAFAVAEEMDHIPRACPGFHTESGGWRERWSLDEAIHQAYSLNEAEGPSPVVSGAVAASYLHA